MNLWRLNIKTASKNNINPRIFCIEKNILGVGWSVETDNNDLSDKKYIELATERYYKKENRDSGWWKSANSIINKMQINDLCWTRDDDGIYYLGKITGEWQYKNEDEFIEADVVNIRNCEWVRVGTVDEVPGKVVNSFIPSATVQMVNDNTAKVFSQVTYNIKSSKEEYEDINVDSSDIFSIVSSEDCEDIVALYLQKKYDYIIVPSSCKKSTMKYEFVMINKNDGDKAVVQVKNGYVDLNIDEYSKLGVKVYLFTTKGKYLGRDNENIVCINPNEIESFIYENINIIPDRISNILNIIKSYKV